LPNTGIPVRTLQAGLSLKIMNMIKGEDFKKLGVRLPTLFSRKGVEKIINK